MKLIQRQEFIFTINVIIECIKMYLKPVKIIKINSMKVSLKYNIQK